MESTKNHEPPSNIPERLESLQSSIRQAALAAGRDLSEVQLIAVTKNQPPERVREAVEAGQLLYGENRVQEAKVKIPLLPPNLHWHFIGHLQKNKIRQALPLFRLFHGVDSLSLALNMDRIAEELGLYPEVLLQVNVSGEATKFGFQPETLRAELDNLFGLDRLQVVGLMTMAPYSDDPETSRPFFRALRELRNRLQDETGVALDCLSMGMSGDYRVAIEEGATLVRIGTSIFGTRRTAQNSDDE